MDKMKMETPDLTKENVEKLLALFPECATEVEQQGESHARREFRNPEAAAHALQHRRQ